MTAEISGHEQPKSENSVHARDYAGFITLLKWTIVAVAIIATTVVYIISN